VNTVNPNTIPENNVQIDIPEVDEPQNEQEDKKEGYWERTAMPKTQHGLSYKNMRRFNRARRNDGNIRALRFPWQKGFEQ
jgi:hypothetical protein